MIYKDLNDLKEQTFKYKKQGKKIIRTNGCFDIIHPGHIENFKKAKEFGDILVVGINGDNSPYRQKKAGRPINNEEFRTKMLDAIQYIDIIYIYDGETPIKSIKAILPDVLVKGGDYEIDKIIGYKEVIDNGGEVKTIPFIEGYSTTSIVKKILEAYK